MRRRALGACALPACLSLFVCGCAPTPRSQAAPREHTAAALQVLSGARFTWVASECVDGGLDLARSGFERTLVSERHGDTLRFTYDTTFAVSRCDSTEVWSLVPEPEGQWRYSPEAVVTLPEGAACGAPAKQERGVLRMTGDTLQEVRFASAWCRGYDAMFTYRRVPDRPPSAEELIRRYVAHWNRRDAHAVARLFADDGMLIEPFTRTDDGAPRYHKGREHVRAWLAQAFASTPWLGLSLSTLVQQDNDGRPRSAATTGRYVATWRYMDPRLSSPLVGRNLLVVAADEIYSAEIQLLAEPAPLRAPSVSP